MSNTEQQYNIEFNKIHENWLKILKKYENQEFMNSFKKYVIDFYDNNIDAYPSIENLFNPFKYTDPYDIKVIILSLNCEKKSLGLAFSNEFKTSMCEKIEKEIQIEYRRNVFISDISFKKLAAQGVFMPNINLFYTIDKSPMCVEIFWQKIFEFIILLGNNIWFAWGKNEVYINKILHLEEEDNGNKKNPDDKIIINTNIKISDKYFKGNGCFIICNHYLKQYYKKPIEWTNI